VSLRSDRTPDRSTVSTVDRELSVGHGTLRALVHTETEGTLMTRKALLSAGAAVVVAASGIVAGGVALAAPSSHTMHLRATRLQFINTSKSTFVETDVIARAGKRVGYETISCNDGGHQIICSLSFALGTGMLLGHLTIPITSTTSTTVTGAVTGGLGGFAGDKGTVKGTITGKHATYTVKFHS